MICSKCQTDKPATEYYAKPGRKITHRECKTCFKKRMGNRHQRHKMALVEEHGGCCQRCGYNSCPRILSFHHLDPSIKLFTISAKLSSNLEVLREEARKCLLLCPNCHGEVHQGFSLELAA